MYELEQFEQILLDYSEKKNVILLLCCWSQITFSRLTYPIYSACLALNKTTAEGSSDSYSSVSVYLELQEATQQLRTISV